MSQDKEWIRLGVCHTPSEQLRQQLITDLEKYKHFGTPFTGDMADHIIKMFTQELKEAERVARQQTVDNAIALVNRYSIHTPKGAPKGTVARRNLNNRLKKLALTPTNKKEIAE